MAIEVPWNAGWSGEARYEIRPCRWASGKPSMWQPHLPGSGRPIFAKPHMVRQRMSVAKLVCTVCGHSTPKDDRWWFALGEYRGGWFMTTEAPVHHVCAIRALEVCPHLRKHGCEGDLARFPGGYSIIASILGGDQTENDFGVKLNGRGVIGALKFAWPKSRIRIVQREAA